MAVSFLRFRLVRAAIVLFGAPLAAWLTIAIGVSSSLRVRQPQLALRFFPSDARALSEYSAKELKQKKGKPDLDRASKFAVRALSRDLTSVDALRTLAIVAMMRGDQQSANTLIIAAGKLSSRDLPTRLLLIEGEVAKGDVGAALHHYDIALRTSKDASALLFPVLAAAISTEGIVPPLADVLIKKPAWQRGYLSYLAEAQSPTRDILMLLQALQRRDMMLDRDIAQQFVSTMVRRRDYSAGWEIYKIAGGRRPFPASVASFEDGGLAPYDWLLTRGGEVEAETVVQTGSSSRSLIVGGSGSGVAARQLIQLDARKYVFKTVISATSVAEIDRPYWSLKCIGGSEKELIRLRFPAIGAQPVSREVRFAVPKGCAAQWLDLVLAGSLDGPAAESRIDSVSITEY